MTEARNLRSLVASAQLPPGTLVDRTVLGKWHEPLLWRADFPAGPESWRRMLPVRDATGLWPVLLGVHSRGARVEDDLLPPSGTRDGEAGADGTAGDTGTDSDAGSALACWWAEHTAREPADGTALRPYGRRWPGLAPSPARRGDPDTAAASLARSLVAHGTLRDPRIALAPARRSAGIPDAIGWTGTLAHGADTAPYGAVLRSWEERFGTRVVALETEVLHLSVASPPRSVDQALPVAAEHYAFCPAVIRQGAGDLVRYAEKWLVGRGHWSFWWD
ncbi:hypothetical protein CUT44_30490 [Streptomyces carminius]|uniref:DUF4253 domain-containing protein n=1 Tax=Streptomyces carminius TaxID=2665496 RepID=A0A2M8LRF6_9ACTN|nr:DUF4253 domain-containing protein [Streptomyces carminius]PJE94537.1 hypothetical protein CUT44_30490 [Streptomyces carminius]